MRILRSEDLRQALSPMIRALTPSGPLLLHTDLGKLGILDQWKDRETTCSDYLAFLKSLLPNIPLVFPTFNYDFCSTGIYHRQKSPSQVGALTDHLRRQYPHCRSLTPVFHFCILQNHDLSLDPVENCFGMQSLFAELVRQEGTIAFLGAPFCSNTFLHHVEEVCDVTYRFHKRFIGQIIDGEQCYDTTLLYRVRSLEKGSEVVYAWPRLQDDLERRGILHRISIRGTDCLYFRASDLMTYWSQAIRQQENYLLF